MKDLIGVEVGQCLGHIQGDVHLNVEGEGGRVVWSFQEAGQTIFHQFYEENWQPRLRVTTGSQVLDDVGVPHSTQELALLLEAFHNATGGGVPGGEEDGVQHLSSTGELVTSGLVDCTVGANAEGVVLTLDEVKAAVAKATLDWQLLRHFEWESRRKEGRAGAGEAEGSQAQSEGK